MVLYFSATGNTEHIAKELARRLDDECVNLLKPIKNNDFTPVRSERPFVICAPIYVCEMPRFMTSYLKKLKFEGSRDVYFVFTSGGYCGPAGVLAKGIFRKKGTNYKGCAEVQMPRNYVASDHYSMLTEPEIAERLRAAEARLEGMAEDIRTGRKLTARHVYFFETLITVPFNPVWCRFKQPSTDFFATDKCISCGKCQRLCPVNNISMAEGKPVWGLRCAHYMGCIANCPTLAIEYGSITQNKDKYTFGKYSYLLDEEKVK